MVIIFDGTIHVCKAFVIALQYIDDWVIKQRVCRLMFLAKSITGDEVARQLVTALSTKLSIHPNMNIAAMQDGALVNDVAMRTVSMVYNRLMDAPCFSHPLDQVGERMNTPILDDFATMWVSLFSHSLKARRPWRTLTGLSPPSYSSTRWWSKFEVVHQPHNMFGYIPAFLHDNDLPLATTSKLLRIIDDDSACRKLKVELAMTDYAMESFVKATYALEGDCSFALVVYQRFECSLQS